MNANKRYPRQSVLNQIVQVKECVSVTDLHLFYLTCTLVQVSHNKISSETMEYLLTELAKFNLTLLTELATS